MDAAQPVKPSEVTVYVKGIAATVYRDPDRSQPFADGTWANGGTMYVACAASGENSVRAAFKGGIGLTTIATCGEGATA